MLSALRVLNLKLFHPVFPPEKPNFCVITICQNLTHTQTVSPYLISLFRAQKVFGHMLWQHVGDQRFVPTPHLKHLLLLIVHTNLPQEQFPGLELQLHTAGRIEGIKSHICYLASKLYLTNVSNAFFFSCDRKLSSMCDDFQGCSRQAVGQWGVIQCGRTGKSDSHGEQRCRRRSSWQLSSWSWGTWRAL